MSCGKRWVASGLRTVAPEEKKDRSAQYLQQQEDVLDDEEERWKYFVDSGCSVWFNSIKSEDVFHLVL